MQVSFEVGERKAATNVKSADDFKQMEGWRIANLVICQKHKHGVMLVMGDKLDGEGVKCLLETVLQFVAQLQKQIHGS